MDAAITGLGLLEDDGIDLIEAGLLLACADSPDLDLKPTRARLQALALRLHASGAGARSPRARALVLAGILGGEEGLTGDTHEYDDPANADIVSVLRRGRGLPVTLAMLYVGLARRVGWTADALNFPGHVLVRIGTGPVSVTIDPFDGGTILDGSALLDVLRRTLGQHATLEPEHLTALSNRAILVRLIQNVATRARRAGDTTRALELYTRMTAIAPGFTGLWWERARLEQITGRIGPARASLGAMLETTRDEPLRRRVRAALDALARSS